MTTNEAQTSGQTLAKNNPSDVVKVRHYLAQTLDPVHIGTGEFQLGRVDNIIVREPGTSLPKIPGSSIAGVTRANVAMLQNKYGCAGKGREAGEDGEESGDGTDHCAESTCPVCMSFGYSKGQKSFQGLVQFSDARIVLFPVYTLKGPMWITSPGALESAGVSFGVAPDKLDKRLREADHGIIYWLDSSDKQAQRLSIGWLYLPITHQDELDDPSKWKMEKRADKFATLAGGLLAPVLSRIVIVDDELFPIIVENQLEVRTTVSINPKTGAAAKGALFTVEAIPRATFLQFEITVVDPKFFKNPTDQKKPEFDIAKLHTFTEKGLGLIEYLGLGGATTRGMGRVRIRRLAAEETAANAPGGMQ